MIAFVEGVVDEVRDASVVVRAGGWGVEVAAPTGSLARCRVGEVTRLHTHLVLREDGAVLYGFHEPDLLTLFRLMLGVSGVGPKLALAVLSHLPVQVIAQAVQDDDPALLSSAPGVGKRTAERLILELNTRLPDGLVAPAARPAGTAGSALGDEGRDAVDALVALGYREASVKGAISELTGETPDASAETLIRRALAKLR